MKRTKIVCTIGPASNKLGTLIKMIQAGMNVARLNFSHGDYADHARLVKTIRQAARRVGTELAILQDLQGPRIRVGDLPAQGVEAPKGASIALLTEKLFEASKKIAGYAAVPVQYAGLYKDVKKGDLILIEDGKIRLRVVQVRAGIIKCVSLAGGVIKNHKGINVPGVSLRAAVITEKDKADLAFGLKQGVDFVAMSFVKGAGDILRMKKLISALAGGLVGKSNQLPKVIAKIERQEAVENFDEILAAVDAIMVARGDLGIELPAEKVPLLQKEMIAKCLVATKPVIVATQMLDSMIYNPLPTRAEVSDVANAVIDHTDAVMLSGETATGKYPIEAVETMARIARETEKSSYDDLICGPFPIYSKAEALVQAACVLQADLRVKAFVVITTTGRTARLVSRHRPELPIVAFTPSLLTQRQLALSWGARGYFLKNTDWKSYQKRINKILKKNHLVKKGDTIVLVAGHPFVRMKEPNLVTLHQVE